MAHGLSLQSTLVGEVHGHSSLFGAAGAYSTCCLYLLDQAAKEDEVITFKCLPTSVSLEPPQPHLLTRLPKTPPQAGDQMFKRTRLWGIFKFQFQTRKSSKLTSGKSGRQEEFSY